MMSRSSEINVIAVFNIEARQFYLIFLKKAAMQIKRDLIMESIHFRRFKYDERKNLK